MWNLGICTALTSSSNQLYLTISPHDEKLVIIQAAGPYISCSACFALSSRRRNASFYRPCNTYGTMKRWTFRPARCLQALDGVVSMCRVEFARWKKQFDRETARESQRTLVLRGPPGGEESDMHSFGTRSLLSSSSSRSLRVC